MATNINGEPHRIESKLVDVPIIRSKKRKQTLWPRLCPILAALGIFGGIGTLFLGIVCVIVHGVVINDKFFDRAGTALLIVAIPIIFCGSVLLDEVDPSK